MTKFVDTNVDALSVLIGIDDDLSWRGSKYGQLWGDSVKNWNFDETYASKKEKRYYNSYKELHKSLSAVIEDGHDLMQIYIDAAQSANLAIYASPDGHCASPDGQHLLPVYALRCPRGSRFGDWLGDIMDA